MPTRSYSPVCGMQTRTFDKGLTELGDKVACYTVSLDTPFAQKRFCTEANVSHMQTLSDQHDGSFGRNYGVLLEGLAVPCWPGPCSSSTRGAKSLTWSMCRR